MNTIEKKNFEEERALYGIEDAFINECTFKGPLDGESPLKEAKRIHVKDTIFDLRYPIWHICDSLIESSTFTVNSRAPFWYSKNVIIKDSKIYGVKFLRECENININNSIFESSEFGWKTRKINMNNSAVKSDYIFLDSSDIELNNFTLNGKYSFQYNHGLKINNSKLDTKDAFWHADDAIIENSVIKGEYLAWYSKNLTFKNCKIIGTQPFCYSENIKLIDCVMEGADFAFENTTVNASIKSNIISIKNPISGVINCDSVEEIIINEFKKPGEVIINNKIIK